MVFTSDFLVAATVALVVSSLLMFVAPKIATVLTAQIALSIVGVYFGLSMETAVSCAVITVWGVIVVALCAFTSLVKFHTETTRRFFK